MKPAKENMIFSQIASRGIRDKRVIGAFEALEREDYIPLQFKRLPYPDMEIPVRSDRVLLRNFVLASIMSKLPEDSSKKRALIVGDTTGYTTALFGKMFKYCELGTIDNSEIESLRNKLPQVNVAHINNIQNSFDFIFLDGGVYGKSTRDKLSTVFSTRKEKGTQMIYLWREPTYEFSPMQFDFFRVAVKNGSSILISERDIPPLYIPTSSVGESLHILS